MKPFFRHSHPVLLFLSLIPPSWAEQDSPDHLAKKGPSLWAEAVHFRGTFTLDQPANAGRTPKEDSFFEGPFRAHELKTSENALTFSKQGFDALKKLDDRTARRAFRSATTASPGQASGWIGLAVANWDIKSRARYFIHLAEQNAGPKWEHEWCTLLRISLLEQRDHSDDWLALALRTKDERVALSLLRSLLSQSAAPRAAEKIQTVAQKLAPTFPNLIDHSVVHASPLWLRLAATIALKEEDLAGAVTHLVAAIDLEQERLKASRELMPEASLNLGESSARLLQLLIDAGDFRPATDLATSLMRLPRDPYHQAQTIRPIPHDDQAWAIGRRFLAEIAMAQNRWQDLSALPQGYGSREKAEWIFWQLIASKEQGTESAPWMTALRKEPEGSPLILTALTYQAGKRKKISAGSLPLPRNAHELITPLTQPAKPFALPDWEGKKLSLSQLKGQPVLVIFFLGGGCLHCVEQLHEFGPRTAEFKKAGIKIVAVSTDPVSALAETLSSDKTRAESFPFPIISNHKLDVFQAWGAFDEFSGKALHGTYLVNPKGEIIWMTIGNEPYMEPLFLLEESQRLLSPPALQTE